MEKVFKTKICKNCKKEFSPTGGHQENCHECRSIVAKVAKNISNRIWREANREYARVFGRTKRVEDPENARHYDREYYAANSEKLKSRGRMRYAADPGKARGFSSRWHIENPEKAKTCIEEWQKKNPEKVKKTRRKHNAKRRVLGFIAINEPFEGCEAHHFNKVYVIYIPKWLHRSISHNVWTGKGMAEINAKAFAWLTEDWT
jgi:hypothetical protein